MGAVAAAESKDRVIEQAKAEYEAYTAGTLYQRLGTTGAPGGEVEYCGDADDPAQWTVAYVRARDNALVPLTCGDRDRALEDFRRIDRSGVAFWSEVDGSPPVLLVDGIRHFFQPARGRVLVGVVELVGRTVLLVAAGTRLVAVHLAGGVSTVLPLGRPCSVREVDLDHLLAYYRPRATSRPKAQAEPLRPSRRTQDHHLRIVRGRPVDVGAGPPLAEVLSAIFEDIEVRATAPKDRPPGKRLKGKSRVPLVLKYLRKLCELGCRDLVGLIGKIIVQIQQRFPEFEIKAEALADVLRLIAATGTGLIAPRKKGARIWRIHLAELADPTSGLHKRLCCETSARSRVDEGAGQTSSGEREPPPRMSGRAADPTAADCATSATGGGRGGAQGEPSANTRANETVPTPAASGDAPEPPAAVSHLGTADPATDESTEAALRLVEQLCRIPLAGPLLLLWTHTHEFTASVSQLGPVAANGGVEGVGGTRAESGNGDPLMVHAGPPEACTSVVGDQHVDEADAARDFIVGDHVRASEAGAGDEAGTPETDATACLVDDPGVPRATESPVGVDADSGDRRDLEDSEADVPAVDRNALVASVALEWPAHPLRLRAGAPLSVVAWLVRRAARRPVDFGTLGPRGPPVRAGG